MKNLEVRILKKDDYYSWKCSHQNQEEDQGRWDHYLRTNDLSRKNFNNLIKRQNIGIKKGTRFEYSIFFKQEYVGMIVASEVIRGINQSAYLGIAILNQYWGKSIASNSVRMFLKIAFKELNLHRLVAGIEPKNKRSLVAIKALGFRREGISRKTVFLHNEWLDLIQYSITSEDVGIKYKWKK